MGLYNGNVQEQHEKQRHNSSEPVHTHDVGIVSYGSIAAYAYRTRSPYQSQYRRQSMRTMHYRLLRL